MLSPRAATYYLAIILIYFSVIIEYKFALPGLYKLVALVSIIVGLPSIRLNSGLFVQIGSIILICLLLLTLISDQGILFSSRAFVAYIWPICFALSKPRSVSIHALIFIQIMLSMIVAIGGIYEFFYSRDLHGLVPRVGYNELYENMELAYRTRSFVYSVQVNSLVLIVGLIFSLEFGRKFFSSVLFYTINSILVVAGILTYSQMFFAIWGIYLVFAKKITRSSLIALSLLTLCAFVLLTDMESSALDRVLSFSSKANIERLEKQKYAFEDFRLLTGKGVGVTESLNPNYVNSESYYLKLLLEFGLPVSLVILTFLFLKVRSLNKPIKRVIYPLLCSGVFAHTLAAPQFVVIYCLILGKYENSNKFIN